MLTIIVHSVANTSQLGTIISRLITILHHSSVYDVGSLRRKKYTKSTLFSVRERNSFYWHKILARFLYICNVFQNWNHKGVGALQIHPVRCGRILSETFFPWNIGSTRVGKRPTIPALEATKQLWCIPQMPSSLLCPRGQKERKALLNLFCFDEMFLPLFMFSKAYLGWRKKLENGHSLFQVEGVKTWTGNCQKCVHAVLCFLLKSIQFGVDQKKKKKLKSPHCNNKRDNLKFSHFPRK